MRIPRDCDWSEGFKRMLLVLSGMACFGACMGGLLGVLGFKTAAAVVIWAVVMVLLVTGFAG